MVEVREVDGRLVCSTFRVYIRIHYSPPSLPFKPIASPNSRKGVYTILERVCTSPLARLYSILLTSSASSSSLSSFAAAP